MDPLTGRVRGDDEDENGFSAEQQEIEHASSKRAKMSDIDMKYENGSQNSNIDLPLQDLQKKDDIDMNNENISQ